MGGTGGGIADTLVVVFGGSYGIGGDMPIVLVRINSAEDLNTVRLLLRGHTSEGS